MDSLSNIYGVTTLGGDQSDGTVFELTAADIASVIPSVITLASFNSANGSKPTSSVALDSSGDLFGTTSQGGGGDGTVFEIPRASIDGGSPSLITLASFNGGDGSGAGGSLSINSDGDIFGSASGGGSANQGTVFDFFPPQLTFTTQPQTTSAGSTLLFTIAIGDSLGDIAATDNSPVTISIETGPSGASVAGTNIVTATNGVATFSELKLTAIGTYSLIATDAADAAVPATSASFSVTPGPAAQLAFSRQPPAEITAGATFSAIVQIQDAYGNLIANDDSMITLNAGFVPGLLGGTIVVAAVN